MMQKTNENKNEYQRIKYAERKAKAKLVKNVLTGIIIILAVLFFLYANDVRGTNEKTADTVQGVRDEINSLRKDIKTQFESVGSKLLEQDKKIEGVKQSKAIEKQKQSLVKVSTQRPNTGGNCEQWRPLVSQYPWDINVALAICQGESGGLASSENPTDNHKVCLGSRGLFQIGCDSTSNYQAMFDPAANINQAYQLYSRRGFQPWSVYTSGKYLRYL